jgi:transglycosylase-like protein with SLT domain
VASSSSGAPWLIVGGAIFLGAMIMLPVMFVAAALGGVIGGGGGTDNASGSTISCQGGSFTVKETGEVVTAANHPAAEKNYKPGKPDDFIPVYQAAAAHYKLGPQGPNFLSAIHKIETGYSSNVTFSSAGAIGPMQFMPATWEGYAVDVNDGKRNAWDPEDAIFGSAKYLKASGAPSDWPGAILAYNHAGWYVDEVTTDANSFNIAPC